MSELAKSSPEGPRPRPAGAAPPAAAPAAACAPAGGAAPRPPGAAGVGAPDGFDGSKNPFGLPSDATSSMLRAAWPASLNPGFNPTRGSFMLGLVAGPGGAGRSCATPTATAATSAAEKQITRLSNPFIA